MKTEVVKVTRPLCLSEVPNGVYHGNWGGYVVDVMIHGVWYQMHTTDGVRTINAKCMVTVQDGAITVEAAQ